MVEGGNAASLGSRRSKMSLVRRAGTKPAGSRELSASEFPLMYKTCSGEEGTGVPFLGSGKIPVSLHPEVLRGRL